MACCSWFCRGATTSLVCPAAALRLAPSGPAPERQNPTGPAPWMKEFSVSVPEARTGSDVEQVQELQRAHRAAQDEIAKVIIGQTEVVQQMLIALFSGGNVLLVGVPGLA